MGKVIFDISMSLDGFITAANARPEAGLDDGGEQLHEWGFNSADPRRAERTVVLRVILNSAKKNTHR